MAEGLSESERLAVIEELLITLLTGLRPDYSEVGREIYLQNMLGAVLERLPEVQKAVHERAYIKPTEFFQVSSHVLELEERLTTLERQLDATRKTQREILLTISLSPALATMPFRRIVPAHIYLGISDAEVALPLERALTELAESIGFDIVYEEPVEYSSWFRTILTRTREALTQEEVQTRLGKAERALELKHLDTVQAKADLDLSKAAKNISDILSKTSDGIVCLGSITGIKTANGSLVIMALTQEEMLEVAKNPSLKKSPDKLLELLTRHRDTSTSLLTIEPESKNNRSTKPKRKRVTDSKHHLDKRRDIRPRQR
jgi:hypothetical protein